MTNSNIVSSSVKQNFEGNLPEVNKKEQEKRNKEKTNLDDVNKKSGKSGKPYKEEKKESGIISSFNKRFK